MCAPARAGVVITLLAAASTTVSAQVPAWTVSEVRRVGPPAVEFGAVSDAAIDAGDRLWIVDGMAGELYVEEAGGLRRVAGPARRSPPAMVEQTVARAVVADRAPVIGGLMAGPDGTLWIREPARTSEELVDILHPGGRAWRVYDARGRAIASATMPPRFEPLEWRGDLLVGIARDEVGQTSALVLRVSR